MTQLLPDRRAQDVARGRSREALTEARDLAQVDAGAEDREQQGMAEDPDEVVVHLIVEAGGARRVRPGRFVLEAQARAVGEDSPASM
jgi:hypothetical protein